MTRKILFWDSVIPPGTKLLNEETDGTRNRLEEKMLKKKEEKKKPRHDYRRRGKDRHGHTHGSVPA